MDRDLTALAITIAGLIFFFYTVSFMMFYVSITGLILSIGVSFAIMIGGEREDKLKQMEDRIRELEKSAAEKAKQEKE